MTETMTNAELAARLRAYIAKPTVQSYDSCGWLLMDHAEQVAEVLERSGQVAAFADALEEIAALSCDCGTIARRALAHGWFGHETTKGETSDGPGH